MPYGQDPEVQSAPRGGYGLDPEIGSPASPMFAAHGPDASTAFMNGMIGGIPIAGPYLKRAGEAINSAAGAPGVAAQVAGEHPWASTAGNVAGSAIGSVPLMAAMGPLGVVGSGAAIGTADAGARNDWDPTSMAVGGAIGGAGGVAGKAIGEGGSWLGSKALGVLRSYAKPMAADAVDSGTKASYAAMDANGTLLSPQGGQKLADNIRATVAKLDPYNQFGSKSILDKADTLANPVGGVGTTVTGIDELGKVAGNMAETAKAKTASTLAGSIKRNINDFLGDPGQPGDWIGSDQAQGAADRLNAHRLAQIGFKNDAVNEMMERQADRAAVSGSGGNAANTQAQGANKLKWSDQNWTPDEEAAQQAMINGAPGWMRSLSKMAPAGHGLGMAATLGLGLGEALHSGAGLATATAIATPAILGTGAKRLVEALGKAREQTLRDTILSGGVNPYAPNAAQRFIGKAGVPLSRIIAGGAVGVGDQLQQ
jgi:hypothetical protein